MIHHRLTPIAGAARDSASGPPSAQYGHHTSHSIALDSREIVASRLTAMPPSTEPQRWARVRPGLAHKLPGIPRDWVRVLPTPPGYTRGYTLLDARPDRPLREWTDHLEFRDESSEEI